MNIYEYIRIYDERQSYMKTTAHSHIVRTAVGRVGLCKQFYALDRGSNLLVPFFFLSLFPASSRGNSIFQYDFR